jgi:hypothetical protein
LVSRTVRLILLDFDPKAKSRGAKCRMAGDGASTWWGLTVGAAIGVFFGLVFGGNHKWRVWDFFGPEQPGNEDGQSRNGREDG